MSSIELSELEIKKITPEDDLKVFNCGDEDLNEFIQDDAINQMSAKINVTYLCRYKGHIVAFFTLSADSIKINTDDLEGYKDKDIPYKEFPAIKIGRLAVCNPFQSKGIGTKLILLIVGQAFAISEHIGVRYVSVDAYTGSIDFYKKRYFTEFIHDGERRTVQMYLDILKLEQKSG
jgi:GNAT superfamily N-acetyltransferase